MNAKTIRLILLAFLLVLPILGLAACGGESTGDGTERLDDSPAPGATDSLTPEATRPGTTPGAAASPAPGATRPGATPGTTDSLTPEAIRPGTTPGAAASPTPGATSLGTTPGATVPPTEAPSLYLNPCPPAQASTASASSAPAPADLSDQELLVAIFDATDGENWDESGVWASRTPVREWPGVTVGPDGRIAGLALSLNGAEIPAVLGGFSGLTSLQVSDVSGEIPAELGNLASLKSLRISGVSGEIPPELGSLSNLETLDLSGNQLCSGLPPELGRLHNLETLNLANNQLSGKLPPELSGLANLRTLNLRQNEFGGEIPAGLGDFARLTHLDLGDNRLNGPLPPELGNLASLIALNLSNNQLTGEIPQEWDSFAASMGKIPQWGSSEVSSFVALQVMGLTGNQLEGCVSDFLMDYVSPATDGLPVCAPADHAGDTETLVSLYETWDEWGELEWENWLSRASIAEWEGVSVGADGRVAALTLPYREYGDPGVDPELDNLTGLQKLNNAWWVGDPPRCVPGVNGIMYGQFREGRGRPQQTILICSPQDEFVSVSAGDYGTTCSVRASGTLECWNFLDDHDSLRPPGGEFISVSASRRDACGVRRDGLVECWGRVGTPPAGEFASVSAGYGYACGVRRDGPVECWGNLYDDSRQSIRLTGEVVSVSAGNNSICGVRRDGSVECSFSGTTAGKFSSVSTGQYEACGVRTDGSVECWGSHGSEWNRSAPQEGEFASVSVGDDLACGVKTNGAVQCWSSGHQSYRYAPPVGELISVGVVNTHACGVRTDGALVCWGTLTGR